MRSLVTGCAGMIGSHLVERLLKEGHEVVGIDNLSVGRRNNIKDALRSVMFTFHRFDVCNFLFERLGSFDYIFHLAGKADLIPSITDPMEYHRVNVEGTISMLQFARLYPPKKFIYAASSSCYGKPTHFPTHETAPCKPEHPYALTKYIGEQYVMHWAKVYKVPALSLRLFNVYGPRVRTAGGYGAVLGVFLAQLANDKPLTIIGDGTQLRDFTHVRDVCDAFLRAAQDGQPGDIMNVGSGSPRSINSLAQLISPFNYEHIPERPGEPEVTHADNTRISNFLKWKPTVDFKEGVREMVSLKEEWRTAPIWDKASIARATQEWNERLS